MDKWGSKVAVGAPVWPSRFIPMKTPLTQHCIDEHWTEDPCPHPHTVARLIDTCAAAQRRVGMIINLAGHDCLYLDDVPEQLPLRHVRLTAKVLPGPREVAEVIRLATDFWREHPDAFIAIHCAYGFNRTGFAVCSYLIEHCGLTPAAALQSFKHARQPGIRHEQFLAELHARYSHCAHTLPIRSFDPASYEPFYCSCEAGAEQLQRLQDGWSASAFAQARQPSVSSGKAIPLHQTGSHNDLVELPCPSASEPPPRPCEAPADGASVSTDGTCQPEPPWLAAQSS